MKVVNVHPGILPIPPKNWGAVEKVIWNYTLELNKLGIDASFKYLDDINPLEHDVIHCHVTNLANMANERGIEYFLSLHDHHVLFDFPNMEYINQTRHAIQNSIKTFVHTEEFFTHKNFSDLKDKFIYLRHGADPNIYVNKNIERNGLLCVASNGLIGFKNFDRKGFLLAKQVAEALDIRLTICCPSNTREFLLNYGFFNDPNIEILFDLNEEELIHEYNSHKIFLHPSVLEAGHPNLTLIEALFCGIPTVGTYKGSVDLNGMCIVNDLTPISYTNAIHHIQKNYQEYCNLTSKNTSFTWENVVKHLLGNYKKYGYTLEKFKSTLYSSYADPSVDRETYQLAANKIYTTIQEDGSIKLEIRGPLDSSYNIKFIGMRESGDAINQYETNIKNNMWCVSPNNNFIEWCVYVNGELYNIIPVGDK